MNMRGRRLLFLLLLVSLSGGVATAGAMGPGLQAVLQQAAAGEAVPIIVTFAAESDVRPLPAQVKKQRRAAVVRTMQATAERSQTMVRALLHSRGKPFRELWIINGLAMEASPELIRTLVAQPEVNEVRYDALAHLPEVTPSQTGKAEANIEAVHAPDLWARGFTGQGVTVAILDSGVDVNHPDLGPSWRGGSNSWFNPYAAACGQSISNCTACERNAATPCDDATGEDYGHGTAVMGVLVGNSASGSTIGVAPGARWIAAKVFRDDGTAPASRIHQAFQWLLDPDGNPDTDDAPDVVNSSWGFETEPGICDQEFLPDIQALKSAGIAVVFSAGNSGPSLDTSVSPANYAESFAVGSVTPISLISHFSSRGPSACSGDFYPEVVAPGENIRTADLSLNLPGASPVYRILDGTSFAAPHVAGLMALLLSASPGLPVSELESAIQLSAADLGSSGPDNSYGYGMVNALAAFNLISGIPDLSLHDPAPPADDLLLDFGQVPPGQAVSREVTLSNSGSGMLQITGIGSLQAPFSVIADGCTGRSLGSGQSCTITLGFAPAVLEQFTGGLAITSTDPDHRQSPCSSSAAGTPCRRRRSWFRRPMEPRDWRCRWCFSGPSRRMPTAMRSPILSLSQPVEISPMPFPCGWRPPGPVRRPCWRGPAVCLPSLSPVRSAAGARDGF